MSREIDERLVAMRFDNQQFEEGVKESLASLAALREGLDLEGAADSFNEVSKASEKYLQFKEPAQSATNLQNSLSKIGSVAKAAFNGMTAPIKAVGNAINSVYKDVSRLFGLDIAYNLEQSAIKMVRSFTTEPLTTGFQEYETKVDSLRAIMNSTVEAYTKKMGGVYDSDMHRSEVKKKIEDLNRYADQTIYSFSDMMRSLPTLTNMGVDLDEAVSTVKGLHNLAALAGKGAAEASRALFNLGDAFSMGHFEAKDWKTMEYAGIATPDFKKIAIQVAAKNGALIAQSGKYYAKEVTEKGIEKLHEVTAENFRDTLRYDWFDKKTIEDTFKIYSGELTELDLLSMGYRAANDREIIDWFLKIGKEAKTAASEVRTFSKMMEALKEAAQSGWATSYEYIFGSDKDATAFWTPISDAISNVLEESANARNEALRGWSESVVNIDGTVKKTRDAVKDAIIQLVQVFATVKNAVSDAWSTIFGKFDKKRLADITKGFAKFASSLQKWLGDKSIKDSRINKISSALEGFFSILHAVFGTVRDVFGWVGEKVSPIFDWLFDKITSFGTLLQTKFKGTNNLKDVFNILKESSSGGIKTAIDWFSSIPEKISSKWQNFKNWFDGSALKDVLGNIWSGILGFFKAPEGSEDGKSGFDKTVEWLVGAYGTISAKWNEILKWWNNPDNKLHGAVDNIWSGILGFFKAPEGSEGSEDGKSGFDKTVEWLVGAYGTISAKWNEILKWWNNPDNKLHGAVDNIWSGILGFFKAPEGSEDGKSGFDNTIGWLQEKWNAVKNWDGWTEISDFIADSGIGGKISSGLSKLFETIYNFLSPSKVISPQALKPIDRTKLIASGGMSDFSYADFEENDSVITKFKGFVERMKKDWETAKQNIDELIADIPSKIDSFRQMLSKFFGGNGEDSWDSIFDSAVEDAKGLGQISLLFSGSSALSGLGKFFKGTGKLSKEAGSFLKITAETNSKLGKSMGTSLSDFVKGITNPFNTIEKWIGDFHPFGEIDKINNRDTASKVQDFATAALEFAGALWVLVDAFNRIAEITKDESIDFEKTGLIVGQLAGLIAAFEVVTGVTSAIGARKFGSFTGIIGFVFGIEAIFKAFTSIIAATKDLTEGQIKEATILIEKMAGMITTFTMINDLSMLGKHGNMFGAATGLIGFAHAITSMINAFKEIVAIVADDEFRKHDYDRAIGFITQISIIVGSFTAINNLSMLGSHGSMLGAATGLIGFAYSIKAILDAFKDVLGITSSAGFNESSFEAAGNAIAQISLLVGAFTAVNGTLGHSTLGSAVGIIGFAVTIKAMISALGQITSAFDKKGQDSVNGAVEVLKELTKLVNTFSIYKGLGDALGNMPSMFGLSAGGTARSGSGLIGFALSIEAMVTAISRIAAIKDKDSLDSAATILDKLGWIIDKFQIFTGLKGLALGSVSALNDKGKLKSPNGASGIIGFVLAISGLVYDLSELSKIDPDRASKAVDVLQKMSDMINLFVGIDALRQAATSLEGFSGMSGTAAHVGKVIDFAAMAGFIGSIMLLVDKVISVSKDQELDTTQLDKIIPVFTTVGDILSKLTTTVGAFELLNSLAGKFGTAAESTTGSNWFTGANAFVNLLKFIGLAGAALWGIGAALKAAGVSDGQLQEVADTIHTVTPVVQAITGELGAFIGSFAGGVAGSFEAEKMNMATDGIDKAVTNLANVTDEDLEKLKTSVATLNAINDTLPNKSFWELIAGSKVENFAGGMKELGDGFAQFYAGISQVTDWDVFNKAIEGMTSIIELGKLISSFSNESSMYGDAAFDVLHFFGILSGIDTPGFNMTPGDASSYTEIDSLWTSFGEKMAGALVAGFRSKAEELSLAISETIDTAPVITPVLDLGQFKRDAFGMRNMLPGTLSLNLAGAAVAPQDTSALSLEVLNRMADQNAAALTAMGQIMSDGLSGIGSMIGSIKFEMDGIAVGKAVFPYVNAELSKSLARYLRNNTTLKV